MVVKHGEDPSWIYVVKTVSIPLLPHFVVVPTCFASRKYSFYPPNPVTIASLILRFIIVFSALTYIK